jgi:response regulator RpfG family c-di-GMP phosphodiesterase
MTEETKLVDPKDLAVSIQFTSNLPGNRGAAFMTAVPQDAPDMRPLLKRIVEANDYLEGIYQLRALKTELDYHHKELRTHREQKENYSIQCEATWYKTDRRGPFVMAEAQAAQMRNYDSTIERILATIAKTTAEIAELEKKQV